MKTNRCLCMLGTCSLLLTSCASIRQFDVGNTAAETVEETADEKIAADSSPDLDADLDDEEQSTKDSVDDTIDAETIVEPDSEESISVPAAEFGELTISGTFSETEVFNGNGVVITATSIEVTDSWLEIGIKIQNNSGQELEFLGGNGGDTKCAVNNIMVSGGYFCETVADGGEFEDTIHFEKNELQLHGISDVSKITLQFIIHDEDGKWTPYTAAPINLSDTPLPVPGELIQAFTSGAVVAGATPLKLSTESLFNEDGLEIAGYVYAESAIKEKILAVEAINTSDQCRWVTLSNMSVGTTDISQGTLQSEILLPGCAVILGFDIDNIISQEQRELLGISNPSALTLSLKDRKEEDEESTEKTEIVLNLNGKDSAVSNGTEIYNNCGISIAYEGITESSSSYNEDYELLLIIRNTSDSKKKFEIEDDSLVINGITFNNFSRGARLDSGDGYLIVLTLEEDDLSAASIDSIDKIEEIKFNCTVSEGLDTLDAATVTFKPSA